MYIFYIKQEKSWQASNCQARTRVQALAVNVVSRLGSLAGKLALAYLTLLKAYRHRYWKAARQISFGAMLQADLPLRSRALQTASLLAVYPKRQWGYLCRAPDQRGESFHGQYKVS